MKFTDEQIAQIEAAVLKAGHHKFIADNIIAKLQPKPRFAEGHAKMTEFTDEQLREIEHRMREHISTSNDNISRVMQSLKPGPKFTEGQVIAYRHEFRDWKHTYLWYNEDMGKYPNARELDQTEVGPNWVERAEFEKLRDAAIKLCRLVNVEPTNLTIEWEWMRDTLDSLPDHLKGGEL